MRNQTGKKEWCRLPVTFIVAFAVITAWAVVACNRGTAGREETLPGRTRPLLAHDWPHPRDYQFAPSQFEPPDPAEALVTTDSGVRTYVIADSSDPIVRITAALPLGRLHERANEAGASELVTRILTRIGPADPQRPLSLRLDRLGTRFEVEEALDLTRISLEVLAEDWREALSLMIDILRRSDFKDSFIRSYRTGPGYGFSRRVADKGFRPKVELERILGGYPLAPPEPGLAVTTEGVQALVSRSLRANLAVLGIGGNVPRPEVVAALNDLTRGWEPAIALPETASFPKLDREPDLVHTVDTPSLEGWIAIGRAVDGVPESERAAVSVLAHILAIRLNIAARAIRGLANKTIFLLPETGSGAGLLHVRTGGRLESVAPLVEYTLDEITRIQEPDDSITEEELERAKGALVLGKWQEALDGARQASETYAVEMARYGTTDRVLKWPEAVRAVTVEQIKALPSKYLARDQMVTVIVGPIEKIRAARHPRWPVGLERLASSN